MSPLQALVHALLLAAASAQSSGPAVARDLEVTMPDGVVLLADRWWPAGEDDALPYLLIRTPYGRKFEDGVASEWVRQGYGVLVQAVRGRDGSDGTWIPWENELEDGYHSIDWLSRQDWCNGRVGMTGGSYLGHVQILATAAGHPALRCVVPLSPGSDGFSDVPFSGGILCIGLISWLYQCRNPVLDTSGHWPSSARDSSLTVLPLAQIDRKWAGFRSEIWQHWVSVETLADMPGLTIWDRLAQTEHKVPAFHIGGLWDQESMATRRNWEQMNALGGDEQYLIFGPWPHEPNRSTRYADVEYGEDAIVDLTGMRRAWYRRWLKEASSESAEPLDFPPVQVFATGANRWLRLDHWPALDAKPVVWHVAAPGGARPRAFAEGLATTPPDEPVRWSWTYDPTDLPSRRDQDFARSTRLWFRARDEDALVLATAPFEEDTLLTGPAELELALESSAEDTDLFALLVEVSASGEVRALQRPSPLRARFREGFERAVAMRPGEVHAVKLPLGIFAHVFRPGTRLGLALRSDWFPTYARNHGTLEPMAQATRMVTQRNHLHSGGHHASTLRLQMVPLKHLRDGATSR